MASSKTRATLTHSALTQVPGYLGSKARWAVEPRRQAILFVHGFSGTAVGTWKGFDEMLTVDPRSKGLDIFFYGYDTWKNNIRIAAQKLLSLLTTLHNDAGTLIIPDVISRRVPFTGYHSILICAHSLGGLVTRWALLDAYKEQAPWASDVASILFAPAHLAIVNNSLSRFGAKLSRPVREMLEGYNVQILQHETSLALSSKVSELLVPKAVVQAEREKWVMVGSYEHDPVCFFVQGASHTSICKPTRTYILPIKVIFSILQTLPGAPT